MSSIDDLAKLMVRTGGEFRMEIREDRYPCLELMLVCGRGKKENRYSLQQSVALDQVDQCVVPLVELSIERMVRVMTDHLEGSKPQQGG